MKTIFEEYFPDKCIQSDLDQEETRNTHFIFP